MTRTGQFAVGDLVRDARPVYAEGLWRIIRLGFTVNILEPVSPEAMRHGNRASITRADDEMVPDIAATLLATVKRHRRPA